MRLRTRIRYATIADLLISVIIICYAGPFASYNGSLLLIGFVGIAILILGKSKLFYRKKNLILWKVLIIYLCANSLLNLPKSIKYILIVCVGYLLIKRRVDNDDCRIVFKFIKTVAVGEAISVIIQKHIPDIFYAIAKVWYFYSDQFDFVKYAGVYSKQYSGLCYEVSYAAIVCSIGIVICFVEFLFAQKNKIKIINLLSIAIGYYAIILTGKRSIELTIPAVLVVLYLIYAGKKLSIKTIIVVLTMLVVFILTAPQIFDVVENILSRGSGKGIELTSRGSFWALALEMFKENPVIGLGLNSYDTRFNNSGIRSIYYDFAGAHNTYLQLLGETGVIGIIMYFSAIISTLKKGFFVSYQNSNRAIYILIAIGIMSVFLIYGLSGNSLYQPQQLFCFFWCVAVIENLTILESKEIL